VLLTSVLGFWRVKRWERGIISSRGDSNAPPVPLRSNATVLSQLESTFGLHGYSRVDLLREGFGLGRRRNTEDDEIARVAARVEGGATHLDDSRETDPMIPVDLSDADHARAVAILERERRLQHDLREAGLL